MIEEYRNGNIRVWVDAPINQDVIEIRAVRYTYDKEGDDVATQYLSPDDLTWHDCAPLTIIPPLLTLSGLDMSTKLDQDPSSSRPGRSRVVPTTTLRRQKVTVDMTKQERFENALDKAGEALAAASAAADDSQRDTLTRVAATWVQLAQASTINVNG